MKRSALLAISIIILMLGVTFLHGNIYHENNEIYRGFEIPSEIYTTNSSHPEYYTVNESAYPNSIFTLNLTWKELESQVGCTENNIIINEGKVELFSIKYGIKDYQKTIIYGLTPHVNDINLSAQNHLYTIHIVLSVHMKNWALIYFKNETNPFMFKMKNDYKSGEVSFEFGGNYSNQAIENLNVTTFNKIEFPSNYYNKYIYNMNLSLKYPTGKYSKIIMDRQLNSIVYIDKNGSIVDYNYQDHIYKIIGTNNSNKNNTGILNFKNGIGLYESNKTLTDIYTVNETDMEINKSIIKNHGLEHLIIFHNKFLLYSMNGSILYNNKKIDRFSGGEIVYLHTGNNITLSYSKNGIKTLYSINSSFAISDIYQSKFILGNLSTEYSYEGMLSYEKLKYGYISASGDYYFNLTPLDSNFGLRGGYIYIDNENSFENTSIKLENSNILFLQNTLFLYKNNSIYIYSNVNFSSKNYIKIISINQEIKNKETILKFDIMSKVNYTINVNILNYTFYGNSSNIIIKVPNIHSGVYNSTITVSNIAGYEITKAYNIRIENNVTIVKNNVITVNSVNIIKKGDSYFGIVKGNNTSNLTISWYINGKFVNTGNRLTKNLGFGIYKIKASVSANGKVYSSSKTIVILGNIPYYLSIGGILIIVSVFMISKYYYQKFDVEEFIKSHKNMPVKDVYSDARKKRLKSSEVKKTIKMMLNAGGISIESDLNGKKYLIGKEDEKRE